MTNQTRAERLAVRLQSGADDPMWANHTELPKSVAAQAAAELRRLSVVNAELLEALNDMLNAENSYPYSGMSESELAAIEKARAAIARATEE